DVEPGQDREAERRMDGDHCRDGFGFIGPIGRSAIAGHRRFVGMQTRARAESVVQQTRRDLSYLAKYIGFHVPFCYSMARIGELTHTEAPAARKIAKAKSAGGVAAAIAIH